jgi:hypothetical protein
VIYIGCEDNPERTVLPRLLAAGADTSLVHQFKTPLGNGHERQPIFPDDCGLLHDAIVAAAARLVIIDPLLGFLSTHAYNLNDQLIRRALDPLAAVAARTGAVLLLIRHLIKTSNARRALFRGIGATAIVGAARTAFMVARHPDNDDCRLLAGTKNNLSTVAPTLSYRIERNDAGRPFVAYGDAVPLTADELVPAPRRQPGEVLEKAEAFLYDLLGREPVRAATAVRLARVEGLSQRTLARARAKINVVAKQKREGDTNVWYWSLPTDTDSQRILRELFGPDFKPKSVHDALNGEASNHRDTEAQRLNQDGTLSSPFL